MLIYTYFQVDTGNGLACHTGGKGKKNGKGTGECGKSYLC